MHHFFADPTQVAEDTIFITGPDVNHMKHVLRMKPGEEVLISDGTGRDYTCEVEAFEPDRAVVRIHSVCDSRMANLLSSVGMRNSVMRRRRSVLV